MKLLYSPSPRVAGKLSATLPMICAVVLVSASVASAAPILEYTFNDNPTGSTATNTGSASGNDLTMKNSGGVATNLHSANMLGVSGLAGDYAFDNTASTGMGSSFVGGYAATSSTSALASSKSITVTGWFKTAGTTMFSDRAYLLSYGTFSLYGDSVRPGAIQTSINTGGGPTSVTAGYSATESWVFFALTYDGTLTTSNALFYVGTTSSAVSLVSTRDANQGALAATSSILSLGNVTSANRVFDGYLDNFRVFASTTDDSGVLNMANLEAIRANDVSPIPEPSTLAALFAAGLIFAGRRQFRSRSSLG